MTKFNVGDKVIFNKENAHVAKQFDYKINKPYEVQEVYPIHCTVQIINEKGSSHSFDEERFELVETKPTKNQRITALENEVAELRPLKHEVAELKLIVHELRDKKSVEPSTTTTAEDIIEFEGKQYKKVDRVAREGDAVVFGDTGTNPEYVTKGKVYKVLEGEGENAYFRDNQNDRLFVYRELSNRTPETVAVYELIQSKPLTPNQQRAEIIEKAKSFVEETEKYLKQPQADRTKGNYIYQESSNIVKFVINEEKRTIVALLYDKYLENKLNGKGIAKCNPSDVFNEHIGKAIALGRALGLDVSEFEQVVQPAVAVGQIIANEYWNYEVLTLKNNGKNLKATDDGTFADGGDLPNRVWYTIINDTNAKYEEG